MRTGAARPREAADTHLKWDKNVFLRFHSIRNYPNKRKVIILYASYIVLLLY